MNRIMRTAASLATLLLLASACSDSPVAPEGAPLAGAAGTRTFADGATQEVRVHRYDLEGATISWYCGDEPENEFVLMSGQVVEKEMWSWLPTGALHLRVSAKGEGLGGIGLESGDEYRYAEGEKIVFNDAPMGTTSMYSSTFRLINQRTKQGLTLIQRARFVVNANGELVIERSGQTAHCDE